MMKVPEKCVEDMLLAVKWFKKLPENTSNMCLLMFKKFQSLVGTYGKSEDETRETREMEGEK